MSIVYLNGEFLPQEKAMVSVLDRGFLLGDGVYEVLPCYKGRLFRIDEHLRRLRESLTAIRIDNPHSDDTWTDILNGLVERNGGGNLSIYLQVTRGVAPRDHAFPKNVRPTIFAMTSPFPSVDRDLQENGAHVTTMTDDRWMHCNIKAISLLANVLARQYAIEQNKSEAILVRNNMVTEGAASNVFIVKNGALITPPKGRFILGGITRDIVIELAHSNKIKCDEREFTLDELYAAEEVWLTSSIREIVPVVSVDNRVIGNGKPGITWRKMFGLFREFKNKL